MGVKSAPIFRPGPVLGFLPSIQISHRLCPCQKLPKHEEGKELKGQEKRFPKPLQVSKHSHSSPCPFSNVSRNATDGNTPVFLPGESQGQGSLVGCCLWGHTELDTTEVT